MKYIHLYTLFLMLVCHTSCAQKQTEPHKDNINYDIKDTVTSYGPNTMVRNVKQDRNGNILFAASWGGVFRYDGKLFTKISSKIGSRRFWDVLEDRRGNLWFASTDSGVYNYNGKSFQHFTTREGLANNLVMKIYEDKAGNIWFGTGGGASRYDGKSFRNYIINGDAMNEDRTGKTFPDRPPYEVNAIIEDKTGNFWFATRGNTFVYDGKTFTVFTHEGKPFKNVRSIIEDKKGNIWLGGNDGLWRYDGSTFTNFTQKFVGYIYEDKKGNIWTSSEGSDNLSRVLSGYSANTPAWALSRYDAKSLSGKKPTVTEITSEYQGNKRMIFGILEAFDGSIWFGALDGVHRYDGKTITDFKGEEGQK